MASIASLPSAFFDRRWLPDSRPSSRRICFSLAALTDAGDCLRDAVREFLKTELLTAKTRLRELSARSERGLVASSQLRGEIEETQVILEKSSPMQLNFEALEGRWRLIYTNTRDVLPVLFLGQPPGLSQLPLSWPIRVGAIYQEFSSPAMESVKNIITLSVDSIFEEEGIVFTVQAKYRVSGSKRISLEFVSAEVGDLRISPFTESLLAPAFLPRTGFNHQLLLAIREFAFSVPLRQRSPIGSDSTAGYLLTYLDEDMLIGRPLDTGGTFIFNKDERRLDS